MMRGQNNLHPFCARIGVDEANRGRTSNSLAAASLACSKSKSSSSSSHLDSSVGEFGFRFSDFFRISDLGLRILLRILDLGLRTSPHFP
jgi:hypothetical protein